MSWSSSLKPLASVAMLLAFAAVLSPSAMSAAPQPEQFTKGQIDFKQGGKSFTIPLQKGRLEAMPLNFGKKGGEIHNLTLVYAGNDIDKVSVRLVNLDGPKSYALKNIAGFSVQTETGGHSILRPHKGQCTFALKRLDKGKVEGTGSCRGPMDDGRGGQGPLVTDMKFTAVP